MMKTKKFFASILAAAMTISSVPAVTNFVPTTVISTTVNAAFVASSKGYFYDQLSTGEHKKFYNAMEQMLNDGLFVEGEDLDLVSAGYFTSEQVSAYAGGKGNVLNIYGAARDAFTGDHPEVFYVDFSALSIRIKRDSNNQYHLYLGSGRRENYWTESFKSAGDVQTAINTYNEEFEAAYSTLKVDGTDAEFIESAHDYITKHTSYRLENKFDSIDTAQYLIRTSYGSLVNHKAVCEGYARLFKAFMDKKGIPCVLIQGAYKPTPESYELHMWTYVELDSAWYAVDPTIDDPTNTKGNTLGVDGFENHEYLLKGDNKMAVKYAPSGIRSESNYEFTYPPLNYDNYGNEVVYNTNGLMVEFEEGTQKEGEECGVFKVSYKGMGFNAAKEAGYNFMYDCFVERGGVSSQSRSTDKGDKSYDQLVAEAGIGDLAWTGYVFMGTGVQAPPFFENEGDAENIDFYDTPNYFVIKLPQTPYVKFAVTKLEPKVTYEDPKTHAKMYDNTFRGTQEDLIAASDSVFNKNGMYKAPPYPKEVSPGLTSALLIDDGTREISATFDQNLHIDKEYLAENNGRISLRVDIQDMYDIANTSGFEHSAFTNLRLILANGEETEPVSCDVRFIDKKADEYTRDAVILQEFDEYTRTFDGIDPSTLADETIIGYKFDFTPSTMYADDNIFYDFDVKGIRGNDIQFEYQEMRSDGTYPEPGVDVKTTIIKGKEPIAISYLAAHRCAAHAFQSQGYDWNVFGKPTLMDDLSSFDFNNEKFKMNGDSSDMTDGFDDLNEALKGLTHRMVLVATDANEKQEQEMDDLLSNNEGGLNGFKEAAEIDNAEYYNINLTLCKSQIVSTGQAVRVTLGFPAGYGPEDKGKTFKVYHFSKDEKGNITGVNEIPCEITEYGLVVWCDAFSPFAVVPIDVETAELTLSGTEKTEFDKSRTQESVVFTSKTIGGTVSSNQQDPKKSGTIILNKGETATVKIEADPNYDIESVKIGDKSYEITDDNKNSAEIQVDYEQLEKIDGNSAVIDVQFVSETVKTKEAERNEGETVEPHETTSKFKDGFSAVVGHNISLGGNIGLNFYVEFKDAKDVEGAKAIITLPDGSTDTQDITEALKYENNDMPNTYKIHCEVSAKDINKDVKLVVKVNDVVDTENTCSVEHYLTTILNETEKYAKEQNLATALKTYGEVANAYFAKTDITETKAMKAVTAEALANYQASKTGTLPDGVKYRSTSLILESETTLRHYFDVTEENAIASLGLTQKEPGLYYCDIPNIIAQNLSKPQNCGKGNFTISASPLSYAYAVLSNSHANSSIKSLVKALYLYNQAAVSYQSIK